MELCHTIYLPKSDIEVDVTFDYTMYDAGVCSGSVESCYPPEGGDAEISEVMLISTEPADIFPFLNQETIKFLTDRCETWAREAQSAGEI